MEGQVELPFPTMRWSSNAIRSSASSPTGTWKAVTLVNWFHERCGKSEEAHSIMKEDLAGGKVPSSDFGGNAAWWWIMILALNLNSAMKQLVLKESWKTKRMKALRFSFINLPGRIIKKAGQLVIRIAQGHPSLTVLLNARHSIMELGYEPSG